MSLPVAILCGAIGAGTITFLLGLAFGPVGLIVGMCLAPVIGMATASLVE